MAGLLPKRAPPSKLPLKRDASSESGAAVEGQKLCSSSSDIPGPISNSIEAPDFVDSSPPDLVLSRARRTLSTESEKARSIWCFFFQIYNKYKSDLSWIKKDHVYILGKDGTKIERNNE